MKASKTAFLVFLIIIASFVFGTQSIKAPETVENTWTTMASMPAERGGFGVAVVNGRIYAIGGYSNGYLDNNEEYDPTTNSWTAKKPMPTPRSNCAVAAFQNKIYVFGGTIGYNWSSGKGIRSTSTEVYNPMTDTWETKTPMPTNRSDVRANTANGKIYLIGGRTDDLSTVSLNEVYDPSTDSWATKAPMPYPVVSYASAVVDNRIYVIEGQDEYHDPMNPGFTQIYDTVTDIWSQGTPIPNPVWVAAAASATTGIMAPKRIYVMGGDESFDSPSSKNYVYDPQADTWSQGALLPTPRYSAAVVVADDLVYVMGGGIGGYMITKAVERYTPFGYGTVAPVISIISPENKTYVSNNVYLTFTVSKSTSGISYSLDHQANVTITANTTLTGLSEGLHNLTVYASDTVGNRVSETIYFTVAQPSEPLPTTWIAVAIVVLVIAAAVGYVVFRRRK